MKGRSEALMKVLAGVGLVASLLLATIGELRAAEEQQASCDAYGMYTDYCCQCQTSAPLSVCARTYASAKMSCLNAQCDNTMCSPWN